ncbi:hypothetical protein ACFLZP_02510 [Patescibacteria group bacterium]
MAKTYTVKESQAPDPIPAGVYNAQLKGWEEKEGTQFGPYVRLVFEITDGEYAETERSFIASAKLTKGKTSETTSKLFRAVTGLLGQEPKPDEEVSLDKLINKKCQILVENRPGNEEGWQDITKIMPAKK